MSTTYYGIRMYGVDADDINYKLNDDIVKLPAVKKYMEENGIEEDDFDFDDYLSEHVFEGCSETSVKLPNGKTVHVGYERTNGGMEYFGIHASFPWEDCVKDLTKEDVKEAVWKIIGDYIDMYDEEFFGLFCNISDYDWG